MNTSHGARPGAAVPAHLSNNISVSAGPAPIAVFMAKTVGMSACNGHKPSSLLTALRHNRREIQAELGCNGAIDPTRTHLNVTLHGQGRAAQVAKAASERLSALGHINRRRDYVQAIELLISLPEGTGLDVRSYFAASLEWACNRFGAESIVAADIHLDEAAPHCHILVLPVRDGVYVGGKLLGNKSQLKVMRTSFVQTVAEPFGLRAAPEAPRGVGKQKMANQVYFELARIKDPVVHSKLWRKISEAIDKNPLPFHDHLGLPPVSSPAKRIKTMAAIFTSPGKGPRREKKTWIPPAAPLQKPVRHPILLPSTGWNGKQKIGVAGCQCLSCVGFNIKTGMNSLLAGTGQGSADTAADGCAERHLALLHAAHLQSTGQCVTSNASAAGGSYAQ